MKHRYNRRRSEQSKTVSPSAWNDSQYSSMKWRLELYPIMRYRTRRLADEVIDQIQALDITNNDSFRRVTFYPGVTAEAEGMRHGFGIDYWQSYKHLSERIWREADHIEGAVISGIKDTTIEFSSSLERRKLPVSFQFILGWSIFTFICCRLSLMPMIGSLDWTIWLLLGELLVLVVAIMAYIYNITLYRQGMGPVLRALKAIKIEDEKRKNEDIIEAVD